MVTIRVEPDCGNAPRKRILRDVVVALAKQDTDYIAGMLADEVRWTLVGDRILTGHDAIQKWITALPAGDEVIFGSLVTHGREASVDGLLRVSDRGEFGFCHVLRFTGAAKTAKILRVNSYVISTPAES